MLTLPCTFAWQGDYGVVSFGGKLLKTVVAYALNQRRHHQQGTTIPFLERDHDEPHPTRQSRAAAP